MSSDSDSGSDQQPKHNYALILWISLVFFIACLVALFWIFQPNDHPNLHVDNATLTRFTILPPNNTLDYNLVIKMTFRNDNRFLNMHYEKVKAYVVYQGHTFGTSEIKEFYLGCKKENGDVGIVFEGGQRVDFDSIQKTKYDLEKKEGVYEIDLRLSLKIAYKRLWVKEDKNNVRCLFKVPLSSKGVSSTKFESTKCF